MHRARYLYVLVASLVLPVLIGCGGTPTAELEATSVAQRAETRRKARENQTQIAATVEAELAQIGRATATAQVALRATEEVNAYATMQAGATATAAAETRAYIATATAQAAEQANEAAERITSSEGNTAAAATAVARARNTDITMARNWAAHDSYTDVAFSPDGSMLASSSRSGGGYGDASEVVFWNPADATRIRSLALSDDNERYYGAPNVMKWSPDGKYLAVGMAEDFVFVYQASDGSQLRTLRGVGNINDVAWSPDSQNLASANAQGFVDIWSVADGSLVVQLMGHVSAVTRVGWSDDNSVIATSDGDQRIRLWRTSDWSQLLGWDEWKRYGLFIAGPDGPLAASLPDQSASEPTLWKIVDGEELTPIQLGDNRGTPVDIRFSPNGTYFSDGSRVWDAASGRLIHSIEHPEGTQPLSVSWGADNETLAVGYVDGSLWIWRMTTGS